MCHNPNGLWQEVAIKPFIKGRLANVFGLFFRKNTVEPISILIGPFVSIKWNYHLPLFRYKKWVEVSIGHWWYPVELSIADIRFERFQTYLQQLDVITWTDFLTSESTESIFVIER